MKSPQAFYMNRRAAKFACANLAPTDLVKTPLDTALAVLVCLKNSGADECWMLAPCLPGRYQDVFNI
jgi:hypothetical protein